MPTTTAPVLPTTRSRLNEDQRRSFTEDGYLVLRGLLEPSRIAAVRQVFGAVDLRLLALLCAEGLVSEHYASLPFEERFALAGAHAARFGRGWRKEVASPAVFQLHHDPGLLGVMQELLGSPGVAGHAVYNARPKLPQQQLTVVPWHQDSGYFGPESAQQQILTAWVPLVRVTPEDGGMQVARGSHRHGLEPHREERSEGRFLEIASGEPPPETIVDIPLELGDVLIFGNLLWHRSLPNRGRQVRWSIDLRFYSEQLEGLAGGDEYPQRWILTSAQQPATPYAQWYDWTQGGRW
jgi:phytanoyl-CoA hydroxylase